jgi:hypothetical protein
MQKLKPQLQQPPTNRINLLPQLAQALELDLVPLPVPLRPLLDRRNLFPFRKGNIARRTSSVHNVELLVPNERLIASSSSPNYSRSFEPQKNRECFIKEALLPLLLLITTRPRRLEVPRELIYLD